MAADLDLHEHGHAEAYAPAVEVRLVPGDHAVTLEPAKATQAGRRRQVNAFRELGVGDATVLLKNRQDLCVDGVQNADYCVVTPDCALSRQRVPRLRWNHPYMELSDAVAAALDVL